MTTNPDRHAFTTRMPVKDYERLREFAFDVRSSINGVVVKAVLAYLAEHGDCTSG